MVFTVHNPGVEAQLKQLNDTLKALLAVQARIAAAVEKLTAPEPTDLEIEVKGK